jgi:flavin-dependent dehydrogenase
VPDRWDAIVIGGGPAGSAAAIALQACGYRALVLEAARFPRHHVGESLVSLWPVFDQLGVSAEMDAVFPHKRGSCRVWGRGPELQWTEFDSLAGGRAYSLQVERSRFDVILLRRAAAAGAEVREGHRVQAVIWDGERAVGVRYRTGDGTLGDAHAGWVVDASGRAGLVARERTLRAVDPFYPDLSVYAYVKNARRFAGEHAGNLLIEAVPWGWFWFIPLHTGEVSVGLVCDRSGRDRARSRGLARFFADALATSTVVGPMVAAGRLARGPIATASYGYSSTRYAGPGWLLAGDAGSFVDPMWATGVANALIDGLLAAAVVEGVAGGRVSEAAATAHYDAQLAARASRTLSLVRFVYGSNHLHADQPFWRTRRQAAGETPGLAREILRRLSGDPSVRYFRNAFRGMGHEAEALAPLDETLARWDHGEAAIGRLTQDLAAWAPQLRARVSLRRSVGFEGYRLTSGLVIDDDGLEQFTSDDCMAMAFEAMDGRRTAREIVEAAAAAAPPGAWLLTRSRVIAGLAAAWQAGLIEARPAS